MFPQRTSHMLFNTLVLPVFQYCCTVWDNASGETLKQIYLSFKTKLHNCIPTGAGLFCHVLPLYSQLQSLRFHDLCHFSKTSTHVQSNAWLNSKLHQFYFFICVKISRRLIVLCSPHPRIERFKRTFSYLWWCQAVRRAGPRP